MRQADYDLVAARLHYCRTLMARNREAVRAIEFVGRELASVFEVDNPTFNRDRFFIGAAIPRKELDRGRIRD